MKNKKPEEVVVEAVNDLFIRDIEKLLFVHKKYDIPKNKKSKCIFGIYNEDYEEHETFFTPFENGLKQVQKMKGKK